MLLPALYRSLVFFNFFVSRVSLCQISLEKSSSVFFLCLNSDAFPVLSKILGQKLPVIILFVFFLWKFQIMTHLGHKSPPHPHFVFWPLWRYLCLQLSCLVWLSSIPRFVSYSSALFAIYFWCFLNQPWPIYWLSPPWRLYNVCPCCSLSSTSY